MEMREMNVIVRTQFPAIHYWPTCPYEDVRYLKSLHRHVFHVTMKWHVTHDNRDIEFIRTKEQVDLWIDENWRNKELHNMSCEMMADALCRRFGCFYASVFEDNENGSEVIHV